MYTVLFQFIGAALCVGGKSGHNGVQGRTGLAAFNTGVRHRSQHRRGFLYGVAHGFRSCGACLVGFTQLLHIGVRAAHGIGHHIHKMRGVGGRQPERRQVVGHDVGGRCQIHVGGSGQLHDGADALQHGFGIPTGQGHVRQRVRRFTGSEFGGRAHLFGLVGQGLQLVAAGTAQCLHVAHGRFKVTGRVDAVHVRILDLFKGFIDFCGSKCLRYGFDGARALIAVFLGTLGCGFFLGPQGVQLISKILAFCAQIVRADACLIQRFGSRAQLFLLGCQRIAGVTNALLQLGALAFKGSGRAAGLLDFLL